MRIFDLLTFHVEESFKNTFYCVTQFTQKCDLALLVGGFSIAKS